MYRIASASCEHLLPLSFLSDKENGSLAKLENRSGDNSDERKEYQFRVTHRTLLSLRRLNLTASVSPSCLQKKKWMRGKTPCNVQWIDRLFTAIFRMW